MRPILSSGAPVLYEALLRKDLLALRVQFVVDGHVGAICKLPLLNRSIDIFAVVVEVS
jgi:hypothetical protein